MHTIKRRLTFIFISFNKSWYEKERCLQDLNLRGETPLDFKSNALTTRPKQLVFRQNHCGIYNQDKILENHKESDFQLFECNYRINFNQIVTSKLIIFPVSNFQILNLSQKFINWFIRFLKKWIEFKRFPAEQASFLELQNPKFALT